MKALFTALTLVVIAITAATATTRTLNHNNPSPGQFTTWTAIHTASTAGDTILVQGSPINYNNFTLTKSLVVIGPGHNNIDKQNPQKAYMDYVMFSTGSNGSKVYGLDVDYIYAGNDNVDNIEVALSSIYQFNINAKHNCNFWTFDGNVFDGTVQNVQISNYNFGDAVFKNNIFNGWIENMVGTFIGYNYFLNNIFLGNTAHTFRTVQNTYANNNIFYRGGCQPSGPQPSYNNNISFNCAGGNTFPNGTNIQGVDPLFVGSLGVGAFFNYATDYHLQATSTVLTAGTDGTQLGVYGGTGDYSQYGVPRNPYIKTFTLTGPTSINAGDNLQINLKAKVRN